MSGIIARVEARQGWSFKTIIPRRTYWTVQIGHNNEVVYTSETYTTLEKRDQSGVQAAHQLDVPYKIAK
jgi:hypothetical protein